MPIFVHFLGYRWRFFVPRLSLECYAGLKHDSLRDGTGATHIAVFGPTVTTITIMGRVEEGVNRWCVKYIVRMKIGGQGGRLQARISGFLIDFAKFGQIALILEPYLPHIGLGG